MGLGSGDPSWIGEYQLLSRLGEGGQGVVYLATAPSGARVVVKLLRMEGLSDPVARSRLAKEVNAARTVARFCTAQVIEARLEGEQPFVVSEYVEGPTLSEHVRTRGPLSGAALDRLAIGTATALAAIHQARIVHRDFKPGNVILGPDGARVIDFGIAQDLIGDVTSTTAPLLGTPAFTAPEQISSQSVGPPADMFAWGSTMAFAATGHSPFQGSSPVAQLHQVLNADPDLSGVPQPLAAVLSRCLAKDPGQRPTAEQVLLHLLGGVREGALAQGSGDALSRASAYARGLGSDRDSGWAGAGGSPGGRPAGSFTPISPVTSVVPSRRDAGPMARYANTAPVSPASAGTTMLTDAPAGRSFASSEAYTEQLHLPARERGRGRLWGRGDDRDDYRDDDRDDSRDYRGDFAGGGGDGGFGDRPRRRRLGPVAMATTALALVVAVGFGARWIMTATQPPGTARPAAATGPAPSPAAATDGTGQQGGPPGDGGMPAGGTGQQGTGGQGGGAAVTAAFGGTWVGLVEQPPGSGKTFPATVTLTTGTTAGKFELPTLGCTARLRTTSAGQDPQQIMLSARTRTDMQGRCARVAAITLTVSAAGLNFFWQDGANPANTAVATLFRN
jgi:hypothetical protein